MRAEPRWTWTNESGEHCQQAEGDVESEPGESSTTDPRQSERTGEDLNIRGVFLHVMADALGSVVVLVSASVIWLTEWRYKDYLDPLLSLVIVLLVSLSSWPLLRQSVLILLNSIPGQTRFRKLASTLLCQAIIIIL